MRIYSVEGCLRPFVFIALSKLNSHVMKTLTILALLCANICYGQCKYAKNEVDKFTKQTILITKPTTLKLGMLETLTFRACKLNEHRFLQMYFLRQSIVSISKGADLMFSLNNDSIVIIKCNKSEIAEYRISGSNTNWHLTVNYILKEAEYQALLNNTINGIRIYASDEYIEKSIKGKREGNIKKILACI